MLQIGLKEPISVTSDNFCIQKRAIQSLIRTLFDLSSISLKPPQARILVGVPVSNRFSRGWDL